jgi:sec-independent protein translocase protein TatA
MLLPLIGDLGTPELLIILAIVILVFGASKLPELARGSGRALRIFKAETKGLADDDKDDDDQKTTSQRSLEARQAAELEARQTAERDALEARQAAERDTPATRAGDVPAERRDDTTA